MNLRPLLPHALGGGPPRYRYLFIICAAALLCIILASHAHAVELQAIVTGYYGDDFSGITSTGVITEDHPTGIAAAPTILPYGTLIKVTGYNNGNWAKVDDTGAAMRKDAKRGIVHIDLRFKTHADAMQWGRRHMTITVKD